MKTTTLIACLALFAIVTVSACAQSASNQARDIVSAHEKAVVTVQMVVETKLSFEGQSEDEERKMTAVATVIQPGGLCVSSLTNIDPSMYESFMDMMGPKFDYSTNVVDVKIKLSDGSEIPADVVLRDRDLDLAFIKPKKAPDKPMAFVDLTKSAEPRILEDLIVLSRLGAVGGRSTAAAIEQVQSVVTKPRTFYVIAGTLGCGGPAFATDGKVAGIVITRMSPRVQKPEDGSDFPVITAVLPSVTVLKAAEQAAAPAKVKRERPATPPDFSECRASGACPTRS